jgi:methylenetetrahydrofolate dehydrogenase (NADP+)/methenyltetrahydrofolate cyclohydrolase
MTLIDGKAVSTKVLGECRTEIDALKAVGIHPGLAVVIVGDDPASQAYVGSKVRTCRELGMHSQHLALPASTSQEELLAIIHSLNADPAIHGILVQSPPPPHINEADIVRAIRPDKDVDGFHPENVAKLTMESPDAFVPCTPLGCQRLLLEYQIPTAGARVVIIGRSMIVGKPLALLLMARGPGGDATVTIAHSRTRDLPAVCRDADILIAAIGRPRFVTPEFIRPGAVVIDVGINRVPDPSAKNGYRITGDVDFETVAPLCSAITPVPGGVGPMTIAMLISNTLKAARQQHGLPGTRA